MADQCWCKGRVVRTDDNVVCSDSVYHDPFATGAPDRIDTLYVAGPMTGYPECNYPAFNEAADRLRGAGYHVVNPASFGNGRHYVDFIREDLRMLLDCHGVATLDGWWESVGARNEAQVAGILKMPVRPLTEWLERAALELSVPEGGPRGQ